MSHTPTPWHLDHTGICAPNGRTLIDSYDVAGEDEEEVAGNPAFIVACVNSNELLTSALQTIAGIARDAAGQPPEADFAAWVLWQEKKLVAIVNAAQGAL